MEHLAPRARPGPLDHVQYQKPWPEAALPRHAGVVTFRLRGGLPRGVAVLGNRRLGLSGIGIPHRCPFSVNQNWQQVETAASWKSCSLTGLRRPFRGVRGSWSFRLYGDLPRGVAVLCDRRPMLSCFCTPARRIPRRPSNRTFVAVPQLKKKVISSHTVSTNHVSLTVAKCIHFALNVKVMEIRTSLDQSSCG